MEKFCFVPDQIVILHGLLRLSKTVNKTFYITLSKSSEVAAFGVDKERGSWSLHLTWLRHNYLLVARSTEPAIIAIINSCLTYLLIMLSAHCLNDIMHKEE